MAAVPALTGSTVRLREPRPSDIEDRQRCARDPEFLRMMGEAAGPAGPTTADEARAWYEAVRRSPFGWAIERDGRCIGAISLENIKEHDRRASLSIGIFDPAARDRGAGSEAVRLVLRFAFDQIDLHRVGLRVYAFNHRAIHVYERLGFVHEGVERECARVAGEWVDDVMMGILAHEFRALDQAARSARD